MKKKIKKSDEPTSKLFVILIVFIAFIWIALVATIMYLTA